MVTLATIVKLRRRRALSMEDLEYVDWYLKRAAVLSLDLKLAPLMGSDAEHIWTVAGQGRVVFRSPSSLAQDFLLLKRAGRVRVFGKPKSRFTLYYSVAGADDWTEASRHGELMSALSSISDAYKGRERMIAWSEKLVASDAVPSWLQAAPPLDAA